MKDLRDLKDLTIHDVQPDFSMEVIAKISYLQKYQTHFQKDQTHLHVLFQATFPSTSKWYRAGGGETWRTARTFHQKSIAPELKSTAPEGCRKSTQRATKGFREYPIQGYLDHKKTPTSLGPH